MLPDINLLPKQEKQSQLLFFIFLILLAVWLLFSLFVVYQYITTKSDLFTTQAKIRELTMEQANLQQTLANQPVASIDGLANAVSFAEDRAIATSPLIDNLTKLLPGGTSITSYEYSEGIAQIQTEFTAMKEVSDYTASLTNSDYLNGVKVDRLSSSGDDSYIVNHSLEANLLKLKGGE